MSLKVSYKDVNENFVNIYSVPYGKMQNLLINRLAFAYTTSKTYGWRCEYFMVDPYTVISTGYRPIGKEIPKDLIKKYESKADKIDEVYRKGEMSSGKYVRELQKLMISLCKETEKKLEKEQDKGIER